MELEIGILYLSQVIQTVKLQNKKKTVVLTPENLNVLLMTLTKTLFNQIY